MARTIMTLDKSYIDLIVSGNAFGLTVNQVDGDTIKVSGMLENGATLIIDGIETISTATAPKEPIKQLAKPEVPQIKAPEPVKEVQQPAKPVEPVATKPATPPKKKVEQVSLIDIDDPNISAKKRTRIVMKEKADEIKECFIQGMNQMAVSEKYGVSYSTISKFYHANEQEINKAKRQRAEDNMDKILMDFAKGVEEVADVAAKYRLPVSMMHDLYASKLNEIKAIRGKLATSKNSTPAVVTPTIAVRPPQSNVVPERKEEVKPITYSYPPMTKPEVTETVEVPDCVVCPGKENEDIFVDSDTEAEIISKLKDDVPILKIARDFDIPKEKIQKIYFDNKDYICKAREARARKMRESRNVNAGSIASQESLQNLAREFARR